MTFRLPTTLATDSDPAAIAALNRSTATQTWAKTPTSERTSTRTGDRAGESDRFTADDLVAVTFLSVQIPRTAARAILDTQAEALNALLTAIGPDRDLGFDEPDPLAAGWPAWGLETALRGLRDVGWTKATKLIARKRPRLYGRVRVARHYAGRAITHLRHDDYWRNRGGGRPHRHLPPEQWTTESASEAGLAQVNDASPSGRRAALPAGCR